MDAIERGHFSLGIDIGGTSIKAAVTEGEREVWTRRSGEYARPGRGELVGAMAEVLRGAPVKDIGSVGVCAPGVRDASGVIVRAVNVPGLEGMMCSKLIEQVMDGCGMSDVGCGKKVSEFTDAYAAAMDYWRVRRGAGRLLALSLGTGVGACVLDEPDERSGGMPRALIVTGRGPGQIGQMDVGVVEWEEGGEEEHKTKTRAGRPVARRAPIGPDGGRGTLEAYVGLPALRARYGDGVESAVGRMRVDEAPLAALVRALRIAQAIYTPQRVVLLGGVGMRLAPLVGEIRAAVADGLTSLARPGWTLEVGATEFHAARGAAWMGAMK